MTVAVALSTKRFTVLVADTLYSEPGKSRYGSKVLRLKSGIALAGAGETGPMWRRLETDPKWRAAASMEDIYQRLSALGEVVDKAQMDADANNPEDLLVALPDGGLYVTDIYGHKTKGMPLLHRSAELPATIEAIGCGRNAVLSYVAGFLAAMPGKAVRVELQSQARVESLLRDAVAHCSRVDWAVGGPLECIKFMRPRARAGRRRSR